MKSFDWILSVTSVVSGAEKENSFPTFHLLRKYGLEI